jgi:hypothetical protein
LHQVGDLFELNVKLRCQKVNFVANRLNTDVSSKYTHNCGLFCDAFSFSEFSVEW